jgi:hypothetical protein
MYMSNLKASFSPMGFCPGNGLVVDPALWPYVPVLKSGESQQKKQRARDQREERFGSSLKQ